MRLSSRGRRSFRRVPQEEVPQTKLSSDVLTDILSQRTGVGLIDGLLYLPGFPHSRVQARLRAVQK